MLLAPWFVHPRRSPRVSSRVVASPVLATTVIGIAAIDLLVFRGPSLADRYAERTPWNYRAIVAGLDTLCADQTVDTVEGPGLVDELNPSYDPVLRYLMKRGFTRCRYEKGARTLIAGDRDGNFRDHVSRTSLHARGRRGTRTRPLPGSIILIPNAKCQTRGTAHSRLLLHLAFCIWHFRSSPPAGTSRTGCDRRRDCRCGPTLGQNLCARTHGSGKAACSRE